ncbi:hypothetical protein C0J52_21333 [Blattella germanica]|nr:hypothetical protein C0J52_21333 [Blattella germanica]
MSRDCPYSDWSRAPNRLPGTVHKISFGFSTSAVAVTFVNRKAFTIICFYFLFMFIFV